MCHAVEPATRLVTAGKPKLSIYAAQLDCYNCYLTPYAHVAMQLINNTTAALEQRTIVWLQYGTACNSSAGTPWFWRHSPATAAQHKCTVTI